MSQSHNEEAPQIYYIPGNYDESGGVMGGRVNTRNAIEFVAICGPIAYLEFKLLHFSIQTNLIIGIVTLIPLAALCIFGVGGESLSQIVFAFVRYVRKKRTLHYDMFTPAEEKAKALNLDKFLDIASSSGIKAAFQKFQEENLAPSRDNAQQKKKQARKNGKGPKRGRKAAAEEETDEDIRSELRRQERAIKGQTKGWLSAAKKDKGRTKLNNPASKHKG